MKLDPITEYMLEQTKQNEVTVINLSDELLNNPERVEGSIVKSADNLLKDSINNDSQYSKNFKDLESQKYVPGLIKRYSEFATVIIAVQNEITIGMGVLNRGMIYDFIVDSKHRRKGIGTKLMSEIVRAAKEMGYKYVELNVWDKNEKAKQFYVKHKFQPVYNRMRRKI